MEFADGNTFYITLSRKNCDLIKTKGAVDSPRLLLTLVFDPDSGDVTTFYDFRFCS